MFDLVEWIAIGGWRDGDAGKQQLSKFASRALDRFWSKVKKPGKKLSKLDDETRHELRIAGKKLRYACDFFEALHSRKKPSKPRRKFMAALEQLQGDLGNLERYRYGARAKRNLISARSAWTWQVWRAQQLISKRRPFLASAESAHGDLTKAGPFWR
jgi:CHAD domain-containing protein